MTRYASALALAAFMLLASCAAPQPPAAPAPQCGVFEIPTDNGCCRDLNENGICDTADFAENISAEKQREYEEAAERARAKAEESGRLRPTVVNELYENASVIKEYRFLYRGDEVVVANGSIIRRLVNEHDLGMQEVAGRRQKIIINTVSFDFTNKKAVGSCVPPARLVAQKLSTVCDDIIGLEFEVPFDEFAFRLPIEWLRDFLHRTPYEALPGGDIGRLKTMRYSFTDLKDSRRTTHLWTDLQTSMPVRVEVWQGEDLVRQEHYDDLYAI